ncbi:plasmid mobilization relaxosome protein MobC [Loktanella sp. S4079]|uniref:plasmid mobilization relaxosome protein MobC n=1 Tax=Loktanella sp. S4079 TaxID=579483 RepID=UPI000A825869|nr:plasmid mobilization relaxosome protein MobC [Loktanella sp. S4079]
MSEIDPKEALRARSQIPRDLKNPCEGGQASPSNPTKPHNSCAPKERPKAIYVECSDELKVLVRERADAQLQSVSAFVRELVVGTERRRPRPFPTVDPNLVRAVASYGGNLNQVARWLNTATRTGRASEIDALRIAAMLVGIERGLANIIAQHRKPPEC